MDEVPVAALDARLQRQVESARQAFERGNFDSVLDLCRTVLAASPGCLPVRKLHRAAQLKRAPAARGLAKAFRRVSTAPFLLSGNLALATDPLTAIANAQKILEADPGSVSGLRMLGGAATALGWRETAVFAFDALREVEPAEIATLVALGRAHLSAGRADRAVQCAEAALRIEALHAPAQTLRQDASVAQTLREGRWEEGGDFRGKVRPSP
ncbi:MAG: hypothetical protein C0518_12220 [Opitutus sp.]|nr:hypothetical protein [Opitutus sp.]